jgi:hypothetical protein
VDVESENLIFKVPCAGCGVAEHCRAVCRNILHSFAPDPLSQLDLSPSELSFTIAVQTIAALLRGYYFSAPSPLRG